VDRKSLITTLILLLFLPVPFLSQDLPTLKLSVKDYETYGRVTIESSVPLSTHTEKHTAVFIVRIRADKHFVIRRESFQSRFIQSIGWARGSDYYMLTINVTDSDFTHETLSLRNPERLIIDIGLPGMKEAEAKIREAARERPVKKPPEKPKVFEEKPEEKVRPERVQPKPDSTSPSVSAPNQGIKTIVIDPGHGGLEAGAKGKSGTLEKNLTLPISKKLKAVIERNLAYRVVLTREKDVNVSLENRAAIANNNRAVLFISVHVNGSPRKIAYGSETFFLSLNATDEEARRLAYMENNSSEIESRISSDEDDDIMMILWDMAQSAFIKESSQLAENIQIELNSLLGTKNRGIKQAPFKVLTGVACPAILVEVAFLTNPAEEKKLIDENFQNRVAQAIYRGIANFLRSHPLE
jgi:N-acetylmuramoyl-L-alanine amidase